MIPVFKFSPITVPINLNSGESPEIYPTGANISGLMLRSITDMPLYQTLEASFFELKNPVLIWDGDAYIQNKNWTIERLTVAIGNMISKNPTGFLNEGMNFDVNRAQQHGIIMAQRAASGLAMSTYKPENSWRPKRNIAQHTRVTATKVPQLRMPDGTPVF